MNKTLIAAVRVSSWKSLFIKIYYMICSGKMINYACQSSPCHYHTIHKIGNNVFPDNSLKLQLFCENQHSSVSNCCAFKVVPFCTNEQIDLIVIISKCVSCQPTTTNLLFNKFVRPKTCMWILCLLVSIFAISASLFLKWPWSIAEVEA